ncbi:MAG TPA: phage holin family protein [Marmoricola sp.]|nr:phage holin family protein [Marmoricola sp.]
MNFLVRVVVNALALGAAAWLLDGIRVRGQETSQQVLTLLAVGLIFGIVNAVVAPVVKLLSLPFIILTLGLLLLVINALMLLLTSELAQGIDLGFRVDGFWTAVLGSIVITVVSWLFGAVLKD